MSVKFWYSSEKTNSFRPTPWHWSEKPFPAFRGEGARHRGFLAVGQGYAPNFLVAPTDGGYECPTMGFDPTASKLIRTKEKQTLLLITCSPEQDEQVMLITLRGGFRGGYSRVEVRGGEILLQQESNMHCCPVKHLVVRLTHPNGYVYAETGRRCSTGLVEIFSWAGYKTMPTEEFEVWLDSQSPDLTDESRSDAKAKAGASRKAAVVKAEENKREAEVKAQAEAAHQAEIDKKKPTLVPQIEALSRRREAIGLGTVVFREKDWFFNGGYIQQYTEEAVSRAETEVAEAEVKAQEKEAIVANLEKFRPRLEAASVVISHDRDNFTVRGKDDQYSKSFPYDTEGLQKLADFIEAVEIKTREVEAEVQRKAEQARIEAEAATAGLPSNVQIWKRRGGATHAGDGWVIRPDGTLREKDKIICPRPRYTDEGSQVWNQIHAGELVLRWAKSNTAAAHEFEVIFCPETLTDAQLRTAELIQEELAEQWDGRSGMSGNTSSPPVGNGWCLAEKPQVEHGKEESPSNCSIEDLLAKFGRK